MRLKVTNPLFDLAMFLDRLRAMRPILLITTVLLYELATYGQTAQKTDSQSDEPQEAKVYYQNAWEVGELKDCVTLADEESLLLCHGSWFDKVTKCMDTGRSAAACHKEAISDIRQDSKSFLVKFSEKPWPRKDSKGWWYKCRKGEIVTCTRKEIPK
jgi:hypothetical protein